MGPGVEVLEEGRPGVGSAGGAGVGGPGRAGGAGGRGWLGGWGRMVGGTGVGRWHRGNRRGRSPATEKTWG
ncbi:hypothetical protein TIFTF001_013854 [Ficus carica]|uniref:Uncharacterized protein n=1 Tax=Ficus carica TaxID=3494 RepID=A0AA88A2S8_FICCA|nr:hypothetical protein TIFTF001_013854 [Ficus carica]